MKCPPTFPARAIVTMIDGAAFTGTAKTIVAQMREASRATPTETVEGFREQFAARALTWMKQPVRTSDDASFLLDLAEIGIVFIQPVGVRGVR
jgi:hypothetical protein